MSDELDAVALERLFAAHREPSDAPDAVAVLQRRTPPRHRARRRALEAAAPASERSASDLQAIQPQHPQDSDTFVR